MQSDGALAPGPQKLPAGHTVGREGLVESQYEPTGHCSAWAELSGQ